MPPEGSCQALEDLFNHRQRRAALSAKLVPPSETMSPYSRKRDPRGSETTPTVFPNKGGGGATVQMCTLPTHGVLCKRKNHVAIAGAHEGPRLSQEIDGRGYSSSPYIYLSPHNAAHSLHTQWGSRVNECCSVIYDTISFHRAKNRTKR